jgi:hypothetical protein
LIWIKRSNQEKEEEKKTIDVWTHQVQKPFSSRQNPFQNITNPSLPPLHPIKVIQVGLEKKKKEEEERRKKKEVQLGGLTRTLKKSTDRCWWKWFPAGPDPALI